MLAVDVKITGTQDFMNKLRRIDTSFMNFGSAMKEIGKEVVGYYSGQVFASQGGAIGVHWPTLAASTIMYKKKHYPQYATTPLLATGQMQRSFSSQATISSVTIGNDAPYFKYHQSTAPRSKIPYRPMMAINEDVTNIVQKIIQTDVEQKLRSA